MAGKVVKDMSEDFLNCCICMSQFQTPKMLPCIHSFCEECLEKYVANQGTQEIPCPTCRKVCNIPETGVKGLPTNFHLVNLTEKIKLLEKLTFTKKNVSICDSCKSPEVIAYCVDCNFAICSKCQDHHALFPLLQSHSVIPLDQITKPKFQLEWKNAKSPYCGLHSSEKLSFYCKTCSKLICRDCTIVLHSKPEHECTEAVTQFNVTKHVLGQLLKNSKEQLDNGIRFIREAKEDFVAINESNMRVEKELTNHCNEMLKAIAKDYDNQKQKLLTQISDRIKPVATQIQAAKHWVKRMQTTQEMTQKVIEEDNPWELLAMSPDLSGAFQALSGNSTCNWRKLELSRDIFFAHGQVPDIQIGFHYHKADFVVCEKKNFFLCQFDNTRKILQMAQIFRSNGNVEQFMSHKWEDKVPKCEQLVATISPKKRILFIGLGNVVAGFNCGTKSFKTKITLPKTSADKTIKCMWYSDLQNQLYISEANSKSENKDICNTVRSYSSNFQHVANYTVAATSPIESILLARYDLFYYTHNDGLIGHGINNHQNETLQGIDPPTHVMDITDVCFLHYMYRGSSVKPNGQRCDDITLFLLWKGNNVENTGGRTWVLKEYNTKDQKVVGVLEHIKGETDNPPAALFSKDKGNDEMEIYLCDYVGYITTYKRGTYSQVPVKYEKM